MNDKLYIIARYFCCFLLADPLFYVPKYYQLQGSPYLWVLTFDFTHWSIWCRSTWCRLGCLEISHGCSLWLAKIAWFSCMFVAVIQMYLCIILTGLCIACFMSLLTYSAWRREFFGGGNESMEQSSDHTAKTEDCAVQTTFKGISVWWDCGALATFVYIVPWLTHSVTHCCVAEWQAAVTTVVWQLLAKNKAASPCVKSTYTKMHLQYYSQVVRFRGNAGRGYAGSGCLGTFWGRGPCWGVTPVNGPSTLSDCKSCLKFASLLVQVWLYM